MDMFPYPSGAGLHVGHPLGFIGTDVFARYHRMDGRNVLHTMGFDAFGLPAEQYAVQTGQHPRKTTEENIQVYLRQIRRLGLGHVVSNEEVTADGRSERGNFPVFRKNLRQWMMRITAYADRLIDDLDRVEWPEKVKTMQRNWIGRSHGARISFPINGTAIEVFTTRPDTVFGATYMVLAPEHPLVDEIMASEWPSDVDSRWTGGAATPAEAVAAY